MVNKILRLPVIGISGPDTAGEAAWFFSALSVFFSGGWPVRIRPSNTKYFQHVDGLVIGGGADIDPMAYKDKDFVQEYLDKTLQDKKKTLWSRVKLFFSWWYFPFVYFIRKYFSRESSKLDKERDELEFQLIHQAMEKKLPILGICRGSQLINVYFKGDLYQDINRFYYEEPNPRGIFPVKTVYIKDNSKLKQILGLEKLSVNALHHQAVKKTGQGIDIVAREANTLPQGIEHEDHHFVLGIQWHPEFLLFQNRQRNIFKTLVREAKLNKGK
jgi:putative glutamine amidotransferase